jgi:hypothetical protein
MRKQSSLFHLAAVLIMALGATHATLAGEIAAPAAPPAWLTDDPMDPAMADDGNIDSGDMRLRSTGMCRAERDPRSNKRIYFCDYKTSDACVDVRSGDGALTSNGTGSEKRYLCPGPN